MGTGSFANLAGYAMGRIQKGRLIVLLAVLLMLNVYVMLDIPAHQVPAQLARQVPSRTYQALPIAPCAIQALTLMLRVK